MYISVITVDNVAYCLSNKQTILQKKKERDDQMCCNDVVDYIEHFFFDCPTIQKF